MRPIAIQSKWASEYDRCFNEWLITLIKTSDPKMLVLDYVASGQDAIIAFRIAREIREYIEE